MVVTVETEMSGARLRIVFFDDRAVCVVAHAESPAVPVTVTVAPSGVYFLVLVSRPTPGRLRDPSRTRPSEPNTMVHLSPRMYAETPPLAANGPPVHCPCGA